MGTANRQTAPATQFTDLVNEEIRALMARRGINQTKLSELTGISQARISKTIYNNQASLAISNLEAIAEVLGDEPSEILRRAEAALKQTNFALAANKTERHPDMEEGVEYYE